MPTPAKVLIVDDEQHIRSFLALLVQTHLDGPAVIEAADSVTAIALYAKEHPDLVLLDINLIGSTGLEVLGELRRIDPDASVVMVTAVNTLRSVNEAVAKGAIGYIVKDTPFEEIAKSLREIVADRWGEAPDIEPVA